MQPGAAVRAPARSVNDGSAQRVSVGAAMSACLPAQVVADCGDDELGALHRGVAVVGCLDGAGRDDIASLDSGLPDGAWPTRGGRIVLPDRVQVDLDVPVAVAFPEIEPVPVHLACPLFRRPPAAAAHHNAGVSGHPLVQSGFFGLMCGVQLLALGCSPEGLNVVEPRQSGGAPLLGRAGAAAAGPVVVQLAGGQLGMTRTSTQFPGGDVGRPEQQLHHRLGHLGAIPDTVRRQHVPEPAMVQAAGMGSCPRAARLQLLRGGKRQVLIHDDPWWHCRTGLSPAFRPTAGCARSCLGRATAEKKGCRSLAAMRFCAACLQHSDDSGEAMTPLDKNVATPPAGSGGDGVHRRPISDVGAYLDELSPEVRAGLRALGELLVGVAPRAPRVESASRFTARCLGVTDIGQLIDEDRDLEPVARLTTSVALAEWISTHGDVVEVGPGQRSQPPAWTQTTIGDHTYHHPQCLRVHFPPGTLLNDAGCVIGINARTSALESPQVSAYVTRDSHDGARVVLDRLAARADELNPYRGKALRASLSNGLNLHVIDLPSTLTRDTVIVDAQVWREIDLGLTAVRDRYDLLNSHGLGARRGVLLCGPPGTGKSAISAVIAAEVIGVFTVIYVEAKAGEHLLGAVVSEAQRLGGPVLLILEDVDLWCRDRLSGYGRGLSELLQAMDIAADARILTLASTNDAATLDKAAIRTGRFDAIVEVGYPTRENAARILDALLTGLPGAGMVDAAAVVAALPEQTAGSDLREIVRRAVLSADDTGRLSTAALLAEVGSGRYRATTSEGLYL